MAINWCSIIVSVSMSVNIHTLANHWTNQHKTPINIYNTTAKYKFYSIANARHLSFIIWMETNFHRWYNSSTFSLRVTAKIFIIASFIGIYIMNVNENWCIYSFCHQFNQCQKIVVYNIECYLIQSHRTHTHSVTHMREKAVGPKTE